MIKMVYEQITKSVEVKQEILNNKNLIQLIFEVSQICTEIYKGGRKTLLAGNGGSAADAQHIAGEFVSRFFLTDQVYHLLH